MEEKTLKIIGKLLFLSLPVDITPTTWLFHNLFPFPWHRLTNVPMSQDLFSSSYLNQRFFLNLIFTSLSQYICHQECHSSCLKYIQISIYLSLCSLPPFSPRTQILSYNIISYNSLGNS